MPNPQPYNPSKYTQMFSISTQTVSLFCFTLNLLSISNKFLSMSRLLSNHKLPHLGDLVKHRALVAAHVAGLLGQGEGLAEQRGTNYEIEEDEILPRQALEVIMLMDKQVVEMVREVFDMQELNRGLTLDILLWLERKYSWYYWRSRGVYSSLSGRVGEFRREVLDQLVRE